MTRSAFLVRSVLLGTLLLLTLVSRETLATDSGDFEFPVGTRLYLYATGKEQATALEYLSVLCQQLREDSARQTHGVFESVTLIHQEHDDMVALLRSKATGPSEEGKLDDLTNLFDGLRRSETTCLAKDAPKPSRRTDGSALLGLLTLRVADIGERVKLEIVRESIDLSAGQQVLIDNPHYETVGRGPEELPGAAVALGASYLSLAMRYPPTAELSSEVYENDRCALGQKDDTCVRLGGTIHLTLAIRGTRWATPEGSTGEIVEDCSTEGERRRTLVHVLAPSGSSASEGPREEHVNVRPSYVGDCVLFGRLKYRTTIADTPPLQVAVRPTPILLGHVGGPILDGPTLRFPLRERNILPFWGDGTNADMIRRSLQQLTIIDGATLLSLAKRTRAGLVELPLKGMTKDKQEYVRRKLTERLAEYGDHIIFKFFEYDICRDLNQEIFNLLEAVGQNPTNDWRNSCERALWRFSDDAREASSAITKVLVRRGNRTSRLYQAIPALRNSYSATIDLDTGGFETNSGNIREQQDELYVVYPLDENGAAAAPFDLIIQVLWPMPSFLITGRLSLPYLAPTNSASINSGVLAQLNFLEGSVDASIGVMVAAAAVQGTTVSAEWEVSSNVSFVCSMYTIARAGPRSTYALWGGNGDPFYLLDRARSCPVDVRQLATPFDLRIGGGYSSRLGGAFWQVAVPIALRENVRVDFFMRGAGKAQEYDEIGLRLHVDLDPSPLTRWIARRLDP